MSFLFFGGFFLGKRKGGYLEVILTRKSSHLEKAWTAAPHPLRLQCWLILSLGLVQREQLQGSRATQTGSYTDLGKVSQEPGGGHFLCTRPRWTPGAPHWNRKYIFPRNILTKAEGVSEAGSPWDLWWDGTYNAFVESPGVNQIQGSQGTICTGL